jgi:hypothetical protein
MGLSGEKADEYAKSVIKADFEEAGDDDVFRKIKADLDAAGIDKTEHQIRRHMEEFMAQAIQQIKEQG